MTDDNRILIPRRLDSVTNVLALRLSQRQFAAGEKCIIDFTQCTFGQPFTMLLLACELKVLISKNVGVEFVCRSVNNDFRGYADHIGFFRHIGFVRGNHPGNARGSSNYTPINTIDINELKQASGDRPYAELVEETASEIAEVLTQCDRGGVYVALQYSIREIIRNSVEHSLGDELTYFCQFWPALHEAEIVLLDNGVGIFDTINSSGVNFAKSNREALALALRPGISGVSENERAAQDENWRNSGFGLYVTSRFCSERGIFRAISGTSGVTVNAQGQTFHDWKLQGTCVQMRLKTYDLDNSGDRIMQIVQEGEIEAGILGTVKTASKGSKTASKS